MAFSSLSSALYSVGKPIIRALFNTLKTNQDDLNDRVLSVEASTNKVEFFNTTLMTASTFATATGLVLHRVQSSLSVTDAKVVIFDKGGIVTGILEIDIQKASSADFGSSVSIFTTKPSLDMSTASNYDESTNAVLSVTNKVLIEGDYLRLDITSLPTSLGRMQIYLIGEPT